MLLFTVLINVSKKFIPLFQIGEAVNDLVLDLSQLSVDLSRRHAIGKLINFYYCYIIGM
jgi:hypothetical protein